MKRWAVAWVYPTEVSTFATYLGKLRGLELIKGKSEILLSEELVG